jgi:hypothetical protein
MELVRLGNADFHSLNEQHEFRYNQWAFEIARKCLPCLRVGARFAFGYESTPLAATTDGGDEQNAAYDEGC